MLKLIEPEEYQTLIAKVVAQEWLLELLFRMVAGEERSLTDPEAHFNRTVLEANLRRHRIKAQELRAAGQPNLATEQFVAFLEEALSPAKGAAPGIRTT